MAIVRAVAVVVMVSSTIVGTPLPRAKSYRLGKTKEHIKTTWGNLGKHRKTHEKPRNTYAAHRET